jgi:hypothetical protein
MERSSDSVYNGVEEEKHAMTVSIQTLMTRRCHARTFLHACCKGKNGPQLAVGVLGESHTRLFRD